jgi:hypothetical protein
MVEVAFFLKYLSRVCVCARAVCVCVCVEGERYMRMR